jgi:hypothetical protein
MVTIALSILLVWQGASQSAPPRGADTRTWYQAYSDGKRAIQQGNWQAAVDSLEAAKRAGAPKPGRRIPFYGDVYDDFIPDYYLAVAYLNLKKYSEADRALNTVLTSGLIGPKDPEYRAFQTVVSSVRSQLGPAQAAGPNSAPSTPTGGNTAANATTTPLPPGSSLNVSQTAIVPNVSQTAIVQPAPQAAIPAGDPRGTGVRAPALTPPGAGGRQANAVANRPASQRLPNYANQGVAPQQAPSVSERTAVGAYLSGQYGEAATILDGLVSGAGASPRAYFFLACSRTALALVGQADAGTIKSAQAILSQAGDTTRFSAEKRYVSPRVLQLLGIKP